jgi:electron transport complex protein RnfE
MSFKSEFSKGIINENPTFRMLLGMCPTLATSLAISNGIGMGLAATFVLVGSNVIISALRKVTPEKIRIPIFVVVIATFVTTVDLIMAMENIDPIAPAHSGKSGGTTRASNKPVTAAL